MALFSKILSFLSDTITM